jgi:hypothetical protein
VRFINHIRLELSLRFLTRACAFFKTIDLPRTIHSPESNRKPFVVPAFDNACKRKFMPRLRGARYDAHSHGKPFF